MRMAMNTPNICLVMNFPFTAKNPIGGLGDDRELLSGGDDVCQLGAQIQHDIMNEDGGGGISK